MKKIFDSIEIIVMIILGLSFFRESFEYDRNTEELLMFYSYLIMGIMLLGLAIMQIKTCFF